MTYVVKSVSEEPHDVFKLKKAKTKRKLDLFYKSTEDIYAPCLDWDSHVCFVTAKGDIVRLKNIKSTKREVDSDTSSSSSSEESDSKSEGSSPLSHKKKGKVVKKKKKELEEETYVKLGFSTKCLCTDVESVYWVFHPITKAIMQVSKNKEIEPYLSEYENNFFSHITDITFDKVNNTLYFVDSGNIFEENQSNIYFICEDTKTVLPISLKNPFYVNSICFFHRNDIMVLFACLTKENKILRFIKKGNGFIKHVFRRFTGSFSPVYIATDNNTLLVLMKDLSGCYTEGKVLELQMNGEVINALFIKGSEFNGICYNPICKKYLFIEKNVIYSY